MPVQLGPRPSTEGEARIEVIPLIDIMFFLLAAFMLVSLSLVNLRSVKVNLPTATTASPDTSGQWLTVSVDRGGLAYLEKQPVGLDELALALSANRHTNATLRVLMSADHDTRHGDLVTVLDAIRSAGVQNVAFEVRSASNPGGRLGRSDPPPGSPVSPLSSVGGESRPGGPARGDAVVPPTAISESPR